MFHTAPPPGTVVEIRRTQPHAIDHIDIEQGVIIHPAMTWLVAYFPGNPMLPADPADPGSIRVLRTGDVVAYRSLVDCDPAWVAGTWDRLAQAGPGLLQAPEAVRIWELAAMLARHKLDAKVTSLITREQWEHWAGRPLTDSDLGRLEQAIPNSSIPEAIGTIIVGLDHRDSDSIAEPFGGVDDS